MEMNTARMYPHPSFELLRQKKGSGMYVFSERLGMGGYFYLSHNGAMPYNREVGPQSTERIHDVYDVLRAVEEGRVMKLAQEEGHKLPLLYGFDMTAAPLGMVIVYEDGRIDEMAKMYIDGARFDLGARLEPREHEPKRGHKITAFSVIPTQRIKGV